MVIKFYKEEVRDWLIDPLATNLKSALWLIGKPVPIPDPECTGEYKLIIMEALKKSTVLPSISYSKKKTIFLSSLTSYLFRHNHCCFSM